MHKRERKERNRQGYIKRKEALQQKSLNDVKLDMSYNDRCFNYAKYHKCAHGYANTWIRKIKIEGKPSFHFTCDCDRCIRKKEVNKCGACGSATLIDLVNKDCDCVSHLCGRCHRRTYNYTYGDSEDVIQYFDKHAPSDDGVHVKLPDAEVKCLDFEKWKNKTIVEEIKEPIVFSQYTSTYAKILEKKKKKPSAMDKAKAICQSLPEENTIPEGGMISTAASPISGISDKLKEYVQKLRSKIMEGLTTIKEKLLANSWIGPVIQKISGLIKAMAYSINVALDYILGICPLKIYPMYKAIKTGSYASIISILADSFFQLRTAELLSKEYVRRLVYSTTNFEYLKMFLIRDCDTIGILSTIIKDYLIHKRDVTAEEFLLKLDELGLVASDVGDNMSPSSRFVKCVTSGETKTSTFWRMFGYKDKIADQSSYEMEKRKYRSKTSRPTM
jgi:hypothetical protein